MSLADEAIELFADRASGATRFTSPTTMPPP